MPETSYEWFVCQCGKERQVRIFDDSDTHRKLAEHFMCKTCEMECDRNMDLCPEVISYENDLGHGVSRCSLTWHHEGRCIPIETTSEEIELVRELRKEMDDERR